MRASFVLLLLLSSIGFAAEVRTKVQYVSSTAVYLDAGRKSGIAKGDTVVISRDGKELARIAVSFVSELSCSCELINAPKLISKDDVALVNINAIPQTTSPEIAKIDDSTAATSVSSDLVLAPSRNNQLSGRVGMEYTVQDNRQPANNDYTEPSFIARASLTKISGSAVSAYVNLRLRRTIRRDDNLSSSSNRIYEAMLAYQPEDNPFSAGAGRLMLRETRGMGYLDGAYLKYDVARNWKIGAVGGIEPDLQNTLIQSDVTKVGAFASFERRVSKESSLQATASLAGRYLQGEVSREFLYQQINYSYDSHLRFFESTEINYNRGWLKDAEGSSFTLASFLLDSRYSFSRALGISIAYDNRTNYYTAEARNIPDSIFVSALQQGFRASLDSRFGSSYFAELGVGIRDGKVNAAKSSSGWARLGSNDFMKSQVSAYANLRWFDSDYSNGIQPSLNLSRDLTSWLTSGIEFGANSYSLSSTSEKINQQWIALLLDFRFANQIYASTNVEYGMGDGRDATILTAGLGYRF